MEEFSDTLARWFAGEEIAGVEYVLNDSVEIVEGEHAGEFAAVISLERLNPEPAFLIELGSGHDLLVPQQWLRPAE